MAKMIYLLNNHHENKLV